MNGRAWSSEDIVRLRELYPSETASHIASLLGRSLSSTYAQAKKLGLAKSPEFFESDKYHGFRKGHSMPGSEKSQFKKGHVPKNKGQRRPGWYAGRMRETQFQKGTRSGAAARNWVPVGTIKADPEGYLRIKVRDAVPGLEPSGYGNTKVWPLLHRQIWEQNRGPIPPGHVVAFRDRDRSRCEIGNLELVSRAEMARRNAMWNRFPSELIEVIQLRGVLKRKLRERYGEKQNTGPARHPIPDAGATDRP